MNPEAIARRLAALGRGISPETLAATRALAASLIGEIDYGALRLQRDLAYGPQERQRLDLFSPLAPSATAPLLLFVHGGGFVAGDKYSPGTPFYHNVGAWAVARGWSAAVMTYRLAPAAQWPSGIEDIQLALRCLRERGGELGLAPGPVVLMGQSAGAAHAAAYVAHPELYAPQAPGLAGLVLLSGIYAFSADSATETERAYLGEDESRYAERSSLTGLLEAELPLLVTLAEYDPPMFESQGLSLLCAWQQRHGQLPPFVYLLGQNHLSPVLLLGLPGEQLGPALERFVERLSAADTP